MSYIYFKKNHGLQFILLNVDKSCLSKFVLSCKTPSEKCKSRQWIIKIKDCTSFAVTYLVYNKTIYVTVCMFFFSRPKMQVYIFIQQNKFNPITYYLRLSQVGMSLAFSYLVKTFLVSKPYKINWFSIALTDLSTSILFLLRQNRACIGFPPDDDHMATSKWIFYRSMTL